MEQHRVCVNTIKTLAMDAVQVATVGIPECPWAQRICHGALDQIFEARPGGPRGQIETVSFCPLDMVR